MAQEGRHREIAGGCHPQVCWERVPFSLYVYFGFEYGFVFCRSDGLKVFWGGCPFGGAAFCLFVVLVFWPFLAFMSVY